MRAAGPLLLLCLAALACAAALRPLTDADSIAGARALDTSYRVKDRVTVPGPQAREYVLPVGEYRPKHADGEGIFYASPSGVIERAGFAKHVVPGGIYVADGPGRPFESPLLYVEPDDGGVSKLPLPASALRGYGATLAFAVKGEELIP
jgi:hypothetical protein